MDWIELGYWGLFLAAFLSATIIPFASATVLGAMILGGFDATTCLVVASIGNTLGGVTSYGLGYLGDWHKLHRWLKVKREKVDYWKERIDKYGAYMALLSWAPFIGDIIAVALGVFRVNALKVTAYMLIGKTIRYAVVIWVTQPFLD